MNIPVLAVDPGNVMSAYVVYCDGVIIEKGKIENEILLQKIECNSFSGKTSLLAIEMVACYGMPVGATIFDTVWWTGIFSYAYGINATTRVYRKDVKMHLCNSMRAKDANIRQAIIDMYEPKGGGKIPQIGTIKNPGPLYGVSKDIWAALGVAITFESLFLKGKNE